ncbi:MAG: DNA repair protein RecN [Cyanobacteria bacterium QS_7_48_42]|jgi:DNA repair protein RecN (Recombination protein N)|nr:MAG: DNA repair protein RecN [Cyanobacteria bacterium QH_10_48_56]PSO71792.1 MAG: DNA repair protein RecN [Cyanobacteria bacterium QH_3_48_40]PSO79697.1 MAG: DNA repair protein RecN [Cyanobacteria bacterium QH_9_48_43]PSP06234.1 MAG: DNA repair protein RecN [Cyanobacteria bacterium QS_7_48_42]PSP06679.1 MAG: DNA repair protein RecN [Cyanobacteria bacterium SW_7_48_12]PSP15102.1 MAG: DNA repair protein RecN [Cyanobacteria bacterium SW_11_48_12]
MLLSLQIRNFALVDQLELDFSSGLNVLTGETGAGKSIILDAIDAALGSKVNARLMRAGSQRAMVEATFSLTPAVSSWLQQQEIERLDEASVVVAREMSLTRGGLRSRSRINGVLVNQELMGQLRRQLVEIAAQGQTAELMIPAIQRELLDLYGGESLQQQKAKVAAADQAYQTAKQAWEKRRQSEQQRLQQIDWLQYQSQELEAASLSDPEELEQLEAERDRLSHVVELRQLSYQAYQALYQTDSGEPAGADLLGQAEAVISDMVRYDAQLEPLLEMVRGALTQVVEAGSQLNAYGEGLETDPEHLAEVESRIRSLKQICRKYGPTLGDAITHAQKLQSELEDLTANGQSLEQLEQEVETCQEKLLKTCTELTQLRQSAAAQLEKQLVAELKPLAMEKVQFQCRLTATQPSAVGADQVTYAFSPNPGEPLKPLSETASGGEMSRFLLALKACLSHSEKQSGTLIFDEIDAGVSGRVASAIADKLYQLAQRHQVLCVTHQPVVAAMADAHFRVDKQISSENGQSDHDSAPRTVVRITALDERAYRREELAQLAGGESAQEAIAFAESLLAQAAQRRQGEQSGRGTGGKEEGETPGRGDKGSRGAGEQGKK